MAILNIDISNSTLVNKSINEGPAAKGLGPLGTYHQKIDNLVEGYSGKIWQRSGDGVIAFFPEVSKAVPAALDLLSAIGEINREYIELLNGIVLFTRIGMHLTEQQFESVPAEERGKLASPDLDFVGKLQKHCPIGRIAISQEAYEVIGFHQPLFRPTLIEEVSDRPIFVLKERLIAPQEETLFKGIPPSQEKIMPPIPFPSWEQVQPGEDLGLRDVPELLQEPVLVILGETAPNQNSPSTAATSDATGMMEALAALRSHIDVRAAVDAWPGTADLVSSGRNVVLVGSGLVNAYSYVINDIMAYLRFAKSGERIYGQLVFGSHKKVRGGPSLGDHQSVGFVSVSRSPFDAYHRLIWVAGTDGKGTQAAALLVKDLVIDAEACLGRMGFRRRHENPTGCVVVPHVEPMTSGRMPGEAPYTRWWIQRYRPIWAVDYQGRNLRVRTA